MGFFWGGRGKGDASLVRFSCLKNYFFFVFKEGWTLTLSLSFYRLRIVKNHGRKKDRGRGLFSGQCHAHKLYKRDIYTFCTHFHTHIHTLFLSGASFFKKKLGSKAFSQNKNNRKKLEKMTGCFARIFSNFYGYSVLFFVLHNIALEQNYQWGGQM